MEFSNILGPISGRPEFQLAVRVGDVLRKAGHETWMAGGAVRDILLGRIPHDFDLATAATPDQVENLFASTVAVGKQFGVIVVVEGELQIEVATFRKDGGYQDGRRPDAVKFAAAEEDAARRDFTINALFLDWATGDIFDFVGGQRDLQDHLIRTVGEPQLRFQEDHLRLLRALRFRAQLGFQIEKKTYWAIVLNKGLLKNISRERVREELGKLLHANFFHLVLQEWKELGLERELFFEVPGVYFNPTLWPQCSEAQLDPWSQFFLAAFKSGTSEIDIRAATKGLRGSKSWQEKILKNLFWFFNSKKFENLRLGEIIDLSFDPDFFRGLEAWIKMEESNLGASAQQKWQSFLKTRPEDKPEPIVGASDLSGSFVGRDLGTALKKAYWMQLESPSSLNLKLEILDTLLDSSPARS